MSITDIVETQDRVKHGFGISTETRDKIANSFTWMIDDYILRNGIPKESVLQIVEQVVEDERNFQRDTK